MDGLMVNTLEIAEQAIIHAWERGDEVEKAKLWIAHDIVKEIRVQREVMQQDAANGSDF